ncbi:MAG: amino acid--tRNA ligase-related protein [Patescibacteria group bacterium]
MRAKYFSNKLHISTLASSPYYRNLVLLRNTVEAACDEYFQDLKAPKVDLYLIAKGISSPMSRGSDSSPIPLQLGSQSAFLVDSAQFGMEPLVCGQFNMVYCYLPSFRGENSDHRHLNQFYHCEAELRGSYLKCMKTAENLVKHIISAVIDSYRSSKFDFDTHNFKEIQNIRSLKFPILTFDDAQILLKKHKLSHLIELRPYGRVLTSKGEIRLAEIVGDNKVPIWVSKYDRDVVAFYQKPDPDDPEKVLNADLIFPSINGRFGGEIIGLGQRQDNRKEMLRSMKRQKIKSINSYKWYIDLRKNSKYRTTSGFGLGIERFIAWMLGLNSIIDASLYPVIKNRKLDY